MKDQQGSWIGWGPGDRGEWVVQFKAKLKRKFTWVRQSPLNDSDLYDDTLALVVMQLQTNYNSDDGRTTFPVTGITTASLQKRVGFVWPPKPPEPPLWERPLVLTFCGTGVPGWVGPDADLGRILQDEKRVQWWYVAYNAAPTGMERNTDQAVAEAFRIINLPENRNRRFVIVGYSQGAIAATKFYLKHIRGSALEKWFLGAVMYGNPMREQGVADSDGVGQLPPVENSGIMDRNMTNTPRTQWREFAHDGDLYASCENDDEGEHKRSICKLIMSFSGIIKGRDSLIAQLIEVGLNPFKEGVALVFAIYDAGLFFVRRTGPHVNYNPHAGADFVRGLL
jgi:hypothetical protein